MRKTFFNIILVVAFLFLTTAIILIFLADLQFGEAKKTEAQFRWQKAEEKYLTAIKLNPANAQYLSGYGDFLRNKSAYQKNPIAWLSKVEKFYECALELNSIDAKSYLNLGQAQLALFLKDKQKYAEKLNLALVNFKKAISSDPNGFGISYAVGYAGMSVWNHLDDNQKEQVLDRLRYVVQSRPTYIEYIYPLVLKKTANLKTLERITETPEELLRKKKEKLNRIEKLRKAINPRPQVTEFIPKEDWQGIAKDGKNVYANGEMYWSGTMDAIINLPEGEVNIVVQARGAKAGGIWPYMLVELDGEEIGEIFVDSAEWKEYSFKIKSPAGLKILSVTFLNDYCDAKEDRNLIVGEARVDER